MTVKIQIEVFWFVTVCTVEIGYQHFRGPCCLHLQGDVTGMGINGMDIGLEWRGFGRCC
jgi:hypothetical protein